ncbi:carbamoyl phosphate synthase small subunit [Halalkalibacillus halophilus]|uniref:carbamoyl phosphate synthase small subunit n=1 Tax=Halalkalibacillus halophilus TaxID=392827 RepID=UPI0003FFBD67|nr:carbamoyl phosphate synthase small subunit [Halalkalibacillus halophilus]
MSNRYLILEDGTIFKGKAFGASVADVHGEVVFQTGMTGYQETLSDPSYKGQIIVMTYPLIGNYGINHDDFETVNPKLQALIVKECVKYPSNFRNEHSLSDFLRQEGIPGLEGIDTRQLVKKIRISGTLKGKMIDTEVDHDLEIKHLNEIELPTNQVSSVSTIKPYVVPGRKERIVLVDYGMKHGILRELTERGCHVTVVPHNTTAEEVLQHRPDGVLLSNGPGNPKDVPEGVQLVKDLIGRLPIFGICLGHQLIALACGANTEPLKFGHRGVNHPVRDLLTDEVYMTSQNHGYTVSLESIKNIPLTITHVALNDQSIEGLKHVQHKIYSVQFHPESSPGPTDANRLFEEFLGELNENQQGGIKACRNEQTYIGS